MGGCPQPRQVGSRKSKEAFILPRVRVKICGLTNAADALLAAGASVRMRSASFLYQADARCFPTTRVYD